MYYILGRGEVIDGYYRNPAASTNPSTIYGFTLKRKNDLMPGSPSLLTSQRPSDTTKARPSFRQYNATGMYFIGYQRGDLRLNIRPKKLLKC